MIVSASRRTDIPALYAPWLKKRIEAGSADVTNPFDARRVRRVSLTPAPGGDMDALVLWTRNPLPLLDAVRGWEGKGIRSLWLVTVTAYPPRLEPAAPPAASAVEALCATAARVGAERVVWRYDPVMLCPAAGLTVDWHRRNFERLARSLRGATRRCTVSLYDEYAKARRRLAKAGFAPLFDEEARLSAVGLLADLREVAESHGMEMRSCCEELTAAGVSEGACIDADLLEKVWGATVDSSRDRGQRPLCRCAPSVDIGAYDTCTHGCLYCYATGARARAEARRGDHSPEGESLIHEESGTRSE